MTAVKKTTPRKTATRKTVAGKPPARKTAVQATDRMTAGSDAAAAREREGHFTRIQQEAYFLAEKDSFLEAPLSYWLAAEAKLRPMEKQQRNDAPDKAGGGTE